MKKKDLKVIVTLFTVLFSVTVFSQRPSRGQGRDRGNRGEERGGKPNALQIINQLDLDKDNMIDRAEASKDEKGKIAKDFDIIDANSDEYISLEELEAALSEDGPMQMSPEKLIETIDENGDGTLNELEVAAKDNRELSLNFSAIDTNADYELDIDELKAFFVKNDDKKRKKRK
ncbi:EF-hand domain-containing protein [Lacinutrix undariae]